MSEQTKIGGKTCEQWQRDIAEGNYKTPDELIGVAFARVAELESVQWDFREQEKVRDVLQAERDALKAEVVYWDRMIEILRADNARLRLPYVMRREPPDREGEWRCITHNGNKCIAEAQRINNQLCVRIFGTLYTVESASSKCWWGSAPLPEIGNIRENNRREDQRMSDIEKKSLITAFVQGAKWWEYRKTRATMRQSDQNEAEEAAKRRAQNGTLGNLPEPMRIKNEQ